jgi:hypothetical protein
MTDTTLENILTAYTNGTYDGYGPCKYGPYDAKENPLAGLAKRSYSLGYKRGRELKKKMEDRAKSDAKAEGATA